jgi:hypothetical protein
MFPLLFYWTGKKGLKKNVISIGDSESDGSSSLEDFIKIIGEDLATKKINIKTFVLVLYGALKVPDSKNIAFVFDAVTINGNKKMQVDTLIKNNEETESAPLRDIFIKGLNTENKDWTRINKYKVSSQTPFYLTNILFNTYKLNTEFKWMEKYLNQ